MIIEDTDYLYYSQKADMLAEFADDLMRDVERWKSSDDLVERQAARDRRVAAELIRAEVSVLRELAAEEREQA